MKYIYLIVISIFIIPSISFAELYECEGMWTNKPCEGKVTASFKEKKPTIDDKQIVLQSKKQSAMHNLLMQASKAKRELDIAYSTEAVEELCNNPTTTLETCRVKVQESEDRLHNMTEKLYAAKIEAKKEKEDKINQEIKQSSTTIVVDYGSRWYTHKHKLTKEQAKERIEQKERKEAYSITGNLEGKHGKGSIEVGGSSKTKIKNRAHKKIR